MTVRCEGLQGFRYSGNLPFSQTLARVVRELDRTLFDSYIKPKSSHITSIVRGGILDGEMDWYETPQPKGFLPRHWECFRLADLEVTEIRSYMFDALMYLVGVHAQVSSAAPSLLDRALGALVHDLAEECLACFRQVRRFGMGGMLRVGTPRPAGGCVLIQEYIGYTGDRVYASNNVAARQPNG